jgi:hypothetical protein
LIAQLFHCPFPNWTSWSRAFRSCRFYLERVAGLIFLYLKLEELENSLFFVVVWIVAPLSISSNRYSISLAGFFIVETEGGA